jgi:predicted  nucleic acid-binding Zn-ribbon protein
MHIENVPTLRRSSRVPTELPILVTSLTGTHFSEVCQTLVVNAHGCALVSPTKLENGIPLRFHSKDGRETTAHVVSCQPYASDNASWMLGARLDRPQNFWGLSDCPEDWAPPPVSPSPRRASASAAVSQKQPAQVIPPVDLIVRQLEAPVRRIIADAVRPLQAEVIALKEKLAHREANPSRFEVSVLGLPPELEQQLGLRLQEDLGPKALEEARQQYAHLLETAKSTIDQRTNESYEAFVGRVADELQAVDQRARAISVDISAHAQATMQRGLEDFHQRMLEGGSSLQRLSEELLEFLRQSLNAEHDARRGDLEQLRAAVSSESSRLQEQIEHMDQRIAQLDKSVRALESGLDQRLGQMSSNTVRETRGQLENAAGTVFEEFTARSDKALGSQLDTANENMKILQRGIIASVSESLKAQSANTLDAVERSIEELARISVERWRSRLAGGLNAMARNLGENFQLAAEPGDDGDNGKER